MSGYKEFEGRTLDDAIREACAYYDASRERLEVEILNDAKGGIFGLMGAKKARIKARLVELSSVLDGLDSRPEKKQQKKRAEAPGEHRRKRDGQEDAPRKERPLDRQAGKKVEIPQEPAVDAEAASVPADAGGGPASSDSGPRQPRSPRRERHRSEGRRAKQENGNGDRATHSAPAGEEMATDADADAEEFTRVPFDQLDAAELESAAREIISRLTVPFLGEATITVTVASDRVRIGITDVDDPGLLIGRDGQTLASLQYLATRMLSNRMKALLRVQIDAGDYRERQDERLREMALGLAEKVKAGGRPQVTRPLSSYHRRVIHMALQDDPLIQTHSKGEGEMKRVMVARKKGQGQA